MENELIKIYNDLGTSGLVVKEGELTEPQFVYFFINFMLIFIAAYIMLLAMFSLYGAIVNENWRDHIFNIFSKEEDPPSGVFSLVMFLVFLLGSTYPPFFTPLFISFGGIVGLSYLVKIAKTKIKGNRDRTECEIRKRNNYISEFIQEEKENECELRGGGQWY